MSKPRPGESGAHPIWLVLGSVVGLILLVAIGYFSWGLINYLTGKSRVVLDENNYDLVIIMVVFAGGFIFATCLTRWYSLRWDNQGFKSRTFFRNFQTSWSEIAKVELNHRDSTQGDILAINIDTILRSKIPNLTPIVVTFHLQNGKKYRIQYLKIAQSENFLTYLLLASGLEKEKFEFSQTVNKDFQATPSLQPWWNQN